MYGKTYKLHNSPALAPAEALLVSSSPAFDGLHDDIKIFILACLYRKLLKKRRPHGEHEPTIVGLTVGRPAAGRPTSDKILVDLKIFTDCTVRIFMEFNQGTVLLYLKPNCTLKFVIFKTVLAPVLVS